MESQKVDDIKTLSANTILKACTSTSNECICKSSSIDDESYSEESNTLCALKLTAKAKHQNSHKSNGRCWSGNLNVRHNQDNQRDFEKRTVAQMITLLTKRTVTENLLSKFNNKQHCYKTKQPVGMFLVQYVL